MPVQHSPTCNKRIFFSLFQAKHFSFQNPDSLQREREDACHAPKSRHDAILSRIKTKITKTL